MGYKNNDKCIQKAFSDERLFVLMTRDATAPKVVLEWIKENLTVQPEAKLREAFECALEMSRRQSEMFGRKIYQGDGDLKMDEIGLIASEYVSAEYIDYGDLNDKAEAQIKKAYMDGYNRAKA